MRRALILAILLVGVPALGVACTSCPGCPETADEAGLPVRVQMHEPAAPR